MVKMVRTAAAPALEGGRKSSPSRELLIDATAALLAERATLDVSLNEIAKRSGLNSALIKYYFGNKEGLLLALLERHADQQMGALEHLVAMDISADQKLKIHISGIINVHYGSPYLNRLIHYVVEMGQEESSERVLEIFVKPMIAAYRAIISQGVKEGAFRCVDPELLYYSLVGSCEHIFRGRRGDMTNELKRRYAEHVREIVLRGVTVTTA